MDGSVVAVAVTAVAGVVAVAAAAVAPASAGAAAARAGPVSTAGDARCVGGDVVGGAGGGPGAQSYVLSPDSTSQQSIYGTPRNQKQRSTQQRTTQEAVRTQRNQNKRHHDKPT